MSKWKHATPSERRQYVAQILGCDPYEPGGWPHAIIDRLIDIRENRGKQAFFEEVGYLLSIS
jgi:hypothetical protein